MCLKVIFTHLSCTLIGVQIYWWFQLEFKLILKLSPHFVLISFVWTYIITLEVGWKFFFWNGQIFNEMNLLTCSNIKWSVTIVLFVSTKRGICVPRWYLAHIWISIRQSDQDKRTMNWWKRQGDGVCGGRWRMERNMF